MMSKAMNWDKAGPGAGMCCSGLRTLNSGYGPIIHLITLSYLALRASPDLEDEQIFLLSWFRDRRHRKIFSSPPFLYWPTPEVLPHQNLLTFFAYLCILKLLFIYYVGGNCMCVSLCVYVSVCMYHSRYVEVRRQLYWIWFSHSIMWYLENELKSSGLAASSFTHWSIS